ncbi:MAG: DNA translocase FtsK [Lachnospiraceae bacterium]|nr:DNA translocase FtsK [Lachnospiraceae bacterium]
MASGQGGNRSSAKKKTTTSSRSTSKNRNTQTRKRSTGSRNTHAEPMDVAIRNEILLIVFLALAIILFLCNFGVVGKVGDAVSDIMFGIFGLMAYIAPVIIFLAIAFGMSNAGNNIAVRKLVAGVIIAVLVGMVFELFAVDPGQAESFQVGEIFKRCSERHTGGGVIAGSLVYASYRFLGMVGTVLALLVVGVICVVIVTEKSFIGGVTNQGRRMYERSMEDAEYRRERARERRIAAEEKRARAEERRAKAAEERRLREEELENEKILRMDKKVSGVMLNTALNKEKEDVEKTRDDIHEIILQPSEETTPEEEIVQAAGESHSCHYIENGSDDISEIRIHGASDEKQTMQIPEETYGDHFADGFEEPAIQQDAMTVLPGADSVVGNSMPPNPVRERVPAFKESAKEERLQQTMQQPVNEGAAKIPRPYQFPSYNLLIKAKNKNNGDSARELKETALHLQKTLETFGVKVTITDISQGPSVTRYELQPEQGVKVSKIVGLADDIKLNLAATDIRIEAPIPGKAAVGIEVPNKENTAVSFRELVESKEFREFPSNLAFAVGKDIGGKIVVTDIAKMPHMLIAGATGSGKSVCINTIIMGILYKAKPEDVKMIMIDPKVVELSVYNGIPHLLIPVVTDPKKAAGALHWGVAEMTDRYKKFADYNVRDLKGYNQKAENLQKAGDPEAPSKLPQILIIVDELADLMMVSPGEVEESICRLAQLARACGIHLIIATQRPSVDVITGLIKANMPSRAAFAVSSGVDSRTILDMVGAEKLLGKGDMLFYPQGYPKPARMQGAFVSDKEVSDVVDFLKNQVIGNVYSDDIEEKIQNIGSGTAASGSAGNGDGGSEYDQYFAEAGRFIIDKDKASIGMLQRVFKIGFNRAARIMDQLSEAGVVGEEEGTKPRKVLMTAEEFERFVEEVL